MEDIAFYSQFKAGLMNDEVVTANIKTSGFVIYESAFWTGVARLLVLVLCSTTTALFITLALLYFKYVLTKGVTIRLKTVLFHYLGSVYLFGLIYSRIYMHCVSCFKWASPPYVPSEFYSSAMKHPEMWLNMLHFMVYSLCSSFNIEHYMIYADSPIITIIKTVQFLFSLSLFTLLISSYVAQQKKK